MNTFAGSSRSASRAVTVLAMVALTLGLAAPASAHNALVSSNPVAGSVLAKAPGSLELVFDQQVNPEFGQIAVTIGDNDPVQVDPVVTGATVTADLSVDTLSHEVPSGGSVLWRIGYRVISADGHPVSGLLDFSVGNGPAAELASPENPAGATTSSSTTWWAIGGIVVLVAGFGVIWSRRGRSARTRP